MNITLPNQLSVIQFLESIPDEQRRNDCFQLVEIITSLTGETPTMWGKSIVGFGTYHYKYASGREGDTVKIGLSPRKEAITLYGVIFYDRNLEYLPELGPHKAGKGCLYIKRLSDVNLEVLKQMITSAYSSYSA